MRTELSEKFLKISWSKALFEILENHYTGLNFFFNADRFGTPKETAAAQELTHAFSDALAKTTQRQDFSNFEDLIFHAAELQSILEDLIHNYRLFLRGFDIRDSFVLKILDFYDKDILPNLKNVKDLAAEGAGLDRFFLENLEAGVACKKAPGYEHLRRIDEKEWVRALAEAGAPRPARGAEP